MRFAAIGSVTSSWAALVIATSVNLAATNYTNIDGVKKKTGSSNCMACLNKEGVWCSRTYSYNVTTGNDVAAQTDANIYAAVASGNAGLTSGALGDAGSCCGSTTLFRTWVGTLGTGGALPNLTSGDTAGTNFESGNSAGQPFVANACIAASKTATG